MRFSSLHRTSGLALLVAAVLGAPVGCAANGASPDDAVASATQPLLIGTFHLPPNPHQSFSSASAWGPSSISPAVLAGDVNGDHRADIVRFGEKGTYVQFSTGTKLGPSQAASWDYGANTGWDASKHPRLLGDVNGDGKADLVAFGDDGVWLSLGTVNGFGPAAYVIANFGYNQAWRVESHLRMLADIDGDGRQDIVAFGNDGVWVARSIGTSFESPRFVLAAFGAKSTAGGWSVTDHPRILADVNGDHRADIVGFGIYGVSVSLSNGSGFAAPVTWSGSFGAGASAGGWGVDNPRYVADVDADGLLDVVGFANDGAWVARSNGSSFLPPEYWYADMGANRGWRTAKHKRFVADVNGDGRADLVGIGDVGVMVALAGTGGFFATPNVLPNFVPQYGAWNPDRHERFLADLSGDGIPDIVGYGAYQTVVAVSSPNAGPNLPPPSSGFNTVPQRRAESVLGAAIAQPDLFAKVMKYVYGDGYNAAAAEFLRVQILNGDIPVEEMLGAKGRVTVASDLATIGYYLEPSVLPPGASDAPGDQGCMFAIEMTHAAIDGASYTPGASAACKALPDHSSYAETYVPAGYVQPLIWGLGWIEDKASWLGGEIGDAASSVYHWTADHWECLVGGLASATVCGTCVGTAIADQATLETATAAVLASCQICLDAAVWAKRVC